MTGILIKEVLACLEGQERLDKVPCIQGYTGELEDPEYGGIYCLWGWGVKGEKNMKAFIARIAKY